MFVVKPSGGQKVEAWPGNMIAVSNERTASLWHVRCVFVSLPWTDHGGIQLPGNVLTFGCLLVLSSRGLQTGVDSEEALAAEEAGDGLDRGRSCQSIAYC